MKKLKKGDPVIIISGPSEKWGKKYKGAVSTISKVEGERVYLHGFEMTKAVKGQGFVKKAASIHISNIAYCEDNKPVKVGIKVDVETNKKIRYSKKSGNTLPNNEKK